MSFLSISKKIPSYLTISVDLHNLWTMSLTLKNLEKTVPIPKMLHMSGYFCGPKIPNWRLITVINISQFCNELFQKLIFPWMMMKKILFSKNFTEKNLCKSFFFNKIGTSKQVFFCGAWQFFQNICFTNNLWTVVCQVIEPNVLKNCLKKVL